MTAKKRTTPQNDPFSDDDGAAEKSAVAADVARMKELNKNEDGDVEVDLDEDAEEDEAPAQPSRSDKRRQRGQNLVAAEKEARERAERELTEERARNERLVHTVLQERYRPTPGQQKDPLDDAEDEVYREQKSMIAEFNANQRTMTPQQAEEYEKRARELERKKYKIAAMRDRREMMNSPQVQQAQQEGQLRQFVTSRYPDVVLNEQALRWGVARYQQLVLKGAPESVETADRAMDESRSEFGLGQQRRPDPSMARKLASHGRGPGAGPPERRTFVMTDQHRKMADAAYGHIKDLNKRYQTYARNVAKQQVEE